MRLLTLIFGGDAIAGLAQGNNMYTLKPGGPTGTLVNVATLVVALAIVARFVRRRTLERRIATSYEAVFGNEEPAWPYEVLGVSNDASPQEIRQAYRSLAKYFHPDRNPDDAQAHEHFLTVQAAYEEIGSP